MTRRNALLGASVSHGFFEVIGGRPLLGRLPTAEEDAPGPDRMAVLSHGLWARRFGADPAVVGQQVVTEAQARADLVAVTQGLARDHPRENEGRSAPFGPLLEEVVGDCLQRLGVLLGAVALVLLIACANVCQSVSRPGRRPGFRAWRRRALTSWPSR